MLLPEQRLAIRKRVPPRLRHKKDMAPVLLAAQLPGNTSTWGVLPFPGQHKAREEEHRAKREKHAIRPEEIERLTERYLARSPYKSRGCRYHSFVVYFSNLQRLGWVEFTGKEEPSAFQDHYPPGPPRRYFRLTDAGRTASDAAWSNPLFFALYGQS